MVMRYHIKLNGEINKEIATRLQLTSAQLLLIHGTAEPRLSESPLSKPSVIRTLLIMNAEIPKDSSIFCTNK